MNPPFIFLHAEWSTMACLAFLMSAVIVTLPPYFLQQPSPFIFDILSLFSSFRFTSIHHSHIHIILFPVSCWYIGVRNTVTSPAVNKPVVCVRVYVYCRISIELVKACHCNLNAAMLNRPYPNDPFPLCAFKTTF